MADIRDLKKLFSSPYDGVEEPRDYVVVSGYVNSHEETIVQEGLTEAEAIKIAEIHFEMSIAKSNQQEAQNAIDAHRLPKFRRVGYRKNEK